VSYLYMRGKVRNVLETPAGVSRDGKEYGGKWQVQLEVDQPLRNGHHKLEIITLNTNRPEGFHEDEIAEVPVGVFVAQGKLIFFEAPEVAGRK